MSTNDNRPLAGLRVLDLSRILAGPFAAQTLGDLGAEVIKVERPGDGDESRLYGPPFLKDTQGVETRDTPMFLAANRNKRSITADFSKPAGRDLIHRLAKVSDIVLENFRVGALARYGLDYKSLSAINPRLIYCSITGFGQTGPYRDRPGYDLIFQAMSGFMGVTGEADGLPGGGPMKVGMSIVDVVTGLYAVNAILAAVHHRERRSGKGQYIDLALVEAGLGVLSHSAQHYLIDGTQPKRRGTEGGGGMPSRMFHAADGAFMLSAGNNAQFGRLCAAIGLPELPLDDRFKTNPQRSRNRKELLEILSARFATWKRTDLVAALNSADVPVSAINDYADVFADPHLRERGVQVTSPHPRAGALKMVRSPIRYSDTKLDRYEVPPQPGEHTQDVLKSLLGMSEAEIRALGADGVI